jgi:membrane protein YdbS with pleckstrin-like domain
MSDGDGRVDDATTAPGDPDAPAERASDGAVDGDDGTAATDSDDVTGTDGSSPGATSGTASGGDTVAGQSGEAGAAAGVSDEADEAGESATDEAGREGASTTDEGPLDPSEVDVSELTGPERSLEPAVRLVWFLRAAIVAVVLGAVSGAASVVLSGPVWVGPVVFTALFVLGGARAHFRYESWSYQVRTDSLFLDRGVLTRVRTVVPYVRIQHVDASRGPVERAFGLATVVVYTAGSRGADVTIPGLTPERADELQERLKRLAIAAEGEDAV